MLVSLVQSRLPPFVGDLGFSCRRGCCCCCCSRRICHDRFDCSAKLTTARGNSFERTVVALTYRTRLTACTASPGRRQQLQRRGLCLRARAAPLLHLDCFAGLLVMRGNVDPGRCWDGVGGIGHGLSVSKSWPNRPQSSMRAQTNRSRGDIRNNMRTVDGRAMHHRANPNCATESRTGPTGWSLIRSVRWGERQMPLTWSNSDGPHL